MTNAEWRRARAIRLIAVRGYLDNGNITEEQAREVLRGCLVPGDEGSRVDDTAYLHMSSVELEYAGIPEEAGC